MADAPKLNTLKKLESTLSKGKIAAALQQSAIGDVPRRVRIDDIYGRSVAEDLASILSA
jgi:hypothetical protein